MSPGQHGRHDLLEQEPFTHHDPLDLADHAICQGRCFGDLSAHG